MKLTTQTDLLPRSPDEILTRIAEVEASGDDWLGTQRMDLLEALDFERVKPFLKPEVTEADWSQKTASEIRAGAVSYLEFAVGKAVGHRGISASRSVDHFTSWLWLLDLLPEDWDEIEFAQYGVPKLRAAADALGVPLPAADDEDRAMLERMGAGHLCEPGCDMGCGA